MRSSLLRTLISMISTAVVLIGIVALMDSGDGRAHAQPFMSKYCEQPVA